MLYKDEFASFLNVTLSFKHFLKVFENTSNEYVVSPYVEDCKFYFFICVSGLCYHK